MAHGDQHEGSYGRDQQPYKHLGSPFVDMVLERSHYPCRLSESEFTILFIYDAFE
jgi:hypothetical protein